MIDNSAINVFIVNRLPVPATVTANDDGTYTIFISAQLSAEQQKRCYLHELHHIQQDDFYKYDVQEIEYYAHN